VVVVSASPPSNEPDEIGNKTASFSLAISRASDRLRAPRVLTKLLCTRKDEPHAFAKQHS